MLIWIAILLLADAGFALWHEHRIARMIAWLHVRIYALIEAVIALALLLIHFMRSG